MLAFGVGGLRYAVDIQLVQEIVQPLELTPVASAPPFVLGLADYRGVVVPVVSLAGRFAAVRTGPERRGYWVVVRGARGLVAWAVDEVRDVFSASPEGQGAVPPLAGGMAERGVDAAYRRDDALVFILDVDRVNAPVLETAAGRATNSTVGA